MTTRFAEQVRGLLSQRDPAYRPAMFIAEEERARLNEKLGNAANYVDLELMREMVQQQPENVEFRKALVSGIISAEFAGVDAFSRKVCEWQTWPVPWELIMAMARQTWDEVRHAQLGMGLLESYGGKVGEYPDTLAGSPPSEASQAAARAGGATGTQIADVMRDPLISLSVTNVALEGAALVLFQGTSELGKKIGDSLMEHCYDYNWADEVTHTTIGDYFVKALCQDNPAEEARALRAHAMFEAMRQRLTGEQSAEIKEFFNEETERGTAALGGQTAATPPGYR